MQAAAMPPGEGNYNVSLSLRGVSLDLHAYHKCSPFQMFRILYFLLSTLFMLM